ncbi:neurofilament heavy polypeptide-like [Cydia amplana]|uniref:neurofilament heavy polypeptide-like n=1 Tax=Cydia amplana TaxID=1869771 RepID=UPI002FE60B55
MSAELVVSGLPGDVTFPKILSFFRMSLKRIHIKQFWIRDIADVQGYLKQITIKLNTIADARKAQNYLDNMPFNFNMMEYPMQAYIPGNQQESMNFVNEDELEDWGRKRRPKRTRPRSRSPGYTQEASKLDMEIELLRKQRQVIEEERRLLMEQKKLEMIKEYGPSVSRDYDNFKDYEPPRKRRQPEPVPKAKRPHQETQRAPKITKGPKNQPRLPLFFQPCKKLIGQMRPIIEKDTTPEEAEILIKLIRAAIRKDLAIALENQEYMKHAEIVDLYRKRHPPEQDEAFVAKILTNIRASFLTPEVKVKEEKDEDEVPKDTENQVNDQKGEADQKTPGDIPENGEKETDVATATADGAVTEPQSQDLGAPVDKLDATTDGAVAEPKSQDLETPVEKLDATTDGTVTEPKSQDLENPVEKLDATTDGAVAEPKSQELNNPIEGADNTNGTAFIAADNSVLDDMKAEEELLADEDPKTADGAAEQ